MPMRVIGMLLGIPEWDVGYDDIELATTSTVRGWESVPITVR